MDKKNDLMKFLLIGFISIALSFGISNLKQSFAEDEEHEKDASALLNAIPQSKVSLADGIRQSTKGTVVPISAKFELDEKGKIALSVYTAEKGLTVDPQNNAFNEISGSPESPTWNPEPEVIKDEGDLKAAKEQLTVLSKGKVSLLDVVEKASKEHPGTVVAAMPESEDNKSVCEVRIDQNGKVSEYHYDVVTGNEVKMDEDKY